eukprot:gene18669-28821_t
MTPGGSHSSECEVRLPVSRRSFQEVESNASYSGILPRLAERLEEACAGTESLEPGDSVFDSQWLPDMTIHDFLVRICKYGNCDPQVFGVMAVYIERFSEQMPLTAYNIHRVVLTAFAIAAKFLDDRRLNMRHYACIGGLPLAHILALEDAFLHTVDWRLFVGSKPSLNDLTFHGSRPDSFCSAVSQISSVTSHWNELSTEQSTYSPFSTP